MTKPRSKKVAPTNAARYAAWRRRVVAELQDYYGGDFSWGDLVEGENDAPFSISECAAVCSFDSGESGAVFAQALIESNEALP